MEGDRGKLARGEQSTQRAIVTAGSPTEPTPRTSERLVRLGRYEVLFELARGGMGTVYVGRLVGAHGFGRLVAIKRLATGNTDADLQSFLAEARLSAQINHPNVVQTFELGEHEGAPFIVMQLVEGVSLALLMNRLADQDRALDPDLAAWLAMQAAKGLHAAHELASLDGTALGIVHRDVSPQNVLISFDGRVYVTDFGIAKLHDAERATQSGVVKGKFAYMSPEQARGQRVDRRSDVFSLGILLYEALTCERLFAAGSPAETILRVVEHTPTDPRQTRRDIPESLVSIVMACLEKRPQDRFASAGALAEALRGYLRLRQSRADETEMAALVAELCPNERQRLREKTRDALRSGPDSAGVETTPKGTVLEGSGSDRGLMHNGTVTAAVATAGLPRAGARKFATGVLVAVGILGAVAVGAWLRAQATRTHTAGAESATVVATTPRPAIPPPDTTPVATPDMTGAPIAGTTAPATATPTATSTTKPRVVATPGVPGTAKPPPTASDRGAPFRSLD